MRRGTMEADGVRGGVHPEERSSATDEKENGGPEPGAEAPVGVNLRRAVNPLHLFADQ